MTKEYKSLIINGYVTDSFLNKSLEDLVSQGYQLVLLTVRGNILLFERDKKDDN